MEKLKKKQFWLCDCGRFIRTDNLFKLTAWLEKHYGVNSKYCKPNPIIRGYRDVSLKINNWYWSKRLTMKQVTIDEHGVTLNELHNDKL